MKSIAAMALLFVAPMMTGATQTAPTVPPAIFSTAELHDYARALVELQKVQSTVAAQGGKLAPAEQKALAQQAHAAMLLILQRHSLDVSAFNAISRAVENRPDIRLQVKQAMMADVMGFDQS